MHAPTGTDMIRIVSGLRLITIPISHYCEKARWALERAGIPFSEEPHVQGVHRIAARRASGGVTVPVLLGEGLVLRDSREIIAWADERAPAPLRLLPSDAAERAEVQRLCARFDRVLGPAGRRLIYVHMFGQRELALEINNHGVPAWEDRLARRGWPLLQRLISGVLGIRPGIEQADERTVFAELDAVAELLADGRPYLLGERLTAADVTFAAMTAPVTVPPEYGVPLPLPEQLSPATAELVRRAREHPAGSFALAVFARHRHETAPLAAAAAAQGAT